MVQSDPSTHVVTLQPVGTQMAGIVGEHVRPGPQLSVPPPEIVQVSHMAPEPPEAWAAGAAIVAETISGTPLARRPAAPIRFSALRRETE